MSWENTINAVKGVRGFQRSDVKFNKRILLPITEGQSEIIESYCKEKSISKSDLIRGLLFDHFKETGYLDKYAPKIDKDQLTIEGEIKRNSPQ